MSAYNLANLIRARFPMIYITSFEEDRVTKFIRSVVTSEKQVKYPREVFTWTQTAGLYSEAAKKIFLIRLVRVKCLSISENTRKMPFLFFMIFMLILV